MSATITPSRPRLTIQNTCNLFADGLLDPLCRDDALVQLDAEHENRVSAWLFEPLALQPLRDQNPPICFSTDWYVITKGYGARHPQYWVRMAHSDREPNDCDRRFRQVLSRNGGLVIDVRWFPSHPDQLLGRTSKSSSYQDLDIILAKLPGAKTVRVPIEEPQRDNLLSRRTAINKISAEFTDAELTDLSLSRILINQYLGQRFPYRVSDIDLVVLIDDRPIIVELKRKYPFMPSGWLGMDQQPFAIMDWYTSIANHPYVYLSLINPVWQHSVPPWHLLKPSSKTAPFITWIAQSLSKNSKVGDLFTNGRKSGIYGNRRKLAALDVQHFTVVGSGLTPELLPLFLNQLALSPANITDLQAKSNAATAAYKGSP